MTLSELSAALDQVSGPPERNTSPWYVQVMMGFCAWLAGILLLLFVALLIDRNLHRDSWGLLLFLGLAGCAGAAVLYATVGEKSTFGSQFALAISLAGQFAMAFSIDEIGNARAAFWSMVLVEAVLVVVMRSRLHRLLSSFGAVLAWALAMAGFDDTGQHQTSLLQVLMWLAAWAPVAFGTYWLVAREARWMAGGRDGLLRPVTYGLVASMAVVPLGPPAFLVPMGMGVSLRSALWPLLALFLALYALALAFTLRNRPLMGVAILFALIDVSVFYYVLGITLLVKSIIMLIIGAALLATAQWLAREPA